MLTTSFFLDKLQISYFLASNSTTKGIGNIYMHAYIYMYLMASLLSYHSIQFYKCDDSEDALFECSLVLHVH